MIMNFCRTAVALLAALAGQAFASQLTKDGRAAAVLIVPDSAPQARAAAERI